jgi:hypothetical protein
VKNEAEACTLEGGKGWHPGGTIRGHWAPPAQDFGNNVPNKLINNIDMIDGEVHDTQRFI